MLFCSELWTYPPHQTHRYPSKVETRSRSSFYRQILERAAHHYSIRIQMNASYAATQGPAASIHKLHHRPLCTNKTILYPDTFFFDHPIRRIIRVASWSGYAPIHDTDFLGTNREI